MDASHDRVIIHIDIDCFYAQVEMNKRPELRDKPMGVQQKNIVVTCNYAARARGVGKCVYIPQAMEACPELELVNGEDLADYRRVSAAIYASLCETGSPVERLGMDENWLDVTQMVKVRQREGNKADEIKGCVFGEFACEECDCLPPLRIGAEIAADLRKMLKEVHGLTTSAGISHNKLLSKMVGGKNKPDNQTVVAPASMLELVKPDLAPTSIPGIGRRTGELLATAQVATIQDLRDASVDSLVEAGITKTQADTIKGLSWGHDPSEVKMSGRPASVGLEDRFMGIYNKEESREKLRWLLGRLVQLLAEDGRKPTNIRVTVRDYYKDKLVKKFHKESRQTRLSPRLFQLVDGGLKPDHEEEIIDTCLNLVGKMVDFADAFHITLMGLAVTDFVQQVEKKSSIKNFFISPKKDGMPQSVPTGTVKRKSLFENSSPEDKRVKSEHHAKNTTETESCDAINTKDAKEVSNQTVSEPKASCSRISEDVQESGDMLSECPAGYDRDVWNNLPEDIRTEILKHPTAPTTKTGISKHMITKENMDKPSRSSPTALTHLRHSEVMHPHPQASQREETETENHSVAGTSISMIEETTPKALVEDFKCPEGYDPEVFRQLPDEIKQELVKEKASPEPKPFPAAVRNNNSRSGGKGKAKPKAKPNNSILNYFSRN